MQPKPPVHYGDYLQLGKILDAQLPESSKRGQMAHDEMLFIIIHQTYELWFKQILHEIDSVRAILKLVPMPSTALATIVGRLQRVTEIQRILVEQIRVIETMTTLDFLDFRDDLIPASGFQSLQFKLLETALGVRATHRLEIEKQFFQSRLKPEERSTLESASQETSLFDLLQAWLERMPFSQFAEWDFWSQYATKVEQMLHRDEQLITNNPNLDEKVRKMELSNLNTTRETFLTVLDASRWEKARKEGKVRLSQTATLNAIFIQLYRDWPVMQVPKQILNLTIEIDELMTTWRYRHAIMVQRILGTKIGTGGSAGSDYLKQTTERNRVFTDFFNLSTFLIPRHEIPALPDFMQIEMGFSYDGHKL
ncbi:MAG: tryptophan 2,3-dioxygenase [Bacteriovoracaceae bacterium]|nr:tryptophan 2,3-dioxygenase [Bacteriovoracaceae bacterium]